MSTIIDLRRRIKSVRNSQQITQAMKTVSMAKFKRAQRQVFEARPYGRVFPELASRIVSRAGGDAHPLCQRRAERIIEVLVVTSDKGLAGAFNSGLLAAAGKFLDGIPAGTEPRLVLIGKKAINGFRRSGRRVDRTYAEKEVQSGRETIRALAEDLMRMYVLNRVDAVYIVYNEFKSILSPRITVSKLLPITVEQDAAEGAVWPPDWEPEVRFLLESVLPLYVESQIHRALYESQAAEQAARMMAMENAAKNAENLIQDLVLALNKIRQASITKELLEIMTAVDALAK